MLEDARVYCNHANKKEIDAEDIKLAVQVRMDHSFTSPPPRDVGCPIMYCSIQCYLIHRIFSFALKQKDLYEFMF